MCEKMSGVIQQYPSKYKGMWTIFGEIYMLMFVLVHLVSSKYLNEYSCGLIFVSIEAVFVK